jgi:hypothetical protein
LQLNGARSDAPCHLVYIRAHLCQSAPGCSVQKEFVKIRVIRVKAFASWFLCFSNLFICGSFFFRSNRWLRAGLKSINQPEDRLVVSFEKFFRAGG